MGNLSRLKVMIIIKGNLSNTISLNNKQNKKEKKYARYAYHRLFVDGIKTDDIDSNFYFCCATCTNTTYKLHARSLLKHQI